MVCDSHQSFEPGRTVMSISELSFAYGRKEVLDKISLDISAGRLLGLLGPNGSGKTTLFKCCLGFLKPRSGEIKLGGQPLSSYAPRHLASHVAYVPRSINRPFPIW